MNQMAINVGIATILSRRVLSNFKEISAKAEQGQGGAETERGGSCTRDVRDYLRQHLTSFLHLNHLETRPRDCLIRD